MPLNPALPESGRPPELNDDCLVALARDGDASAFSELVCRYRRCVSSIALRFVSRHEDAEDIAQETWMSVHAHLAAFRGECSFRTWLWRITRNKSILHVRRAARSAVDLAVVSRDDQCSILESLQSGSGTPETLASEREFRSHAWAAMACLTPQHRRPLYLWAVEGQNLTEIARAMGVSYKAAKTRLFRARSAARDAMRSVEAPRDCTECSIPLAKAS